MIKKIDFYIKIFVVLIAILQPFILYYFCGNLKSISSSWMTFLQPLYIFTNACVSYFFFNIDNWKTPSLLLLLLTSFSVDLYPLIHNIIAILFFIICMSPIMIDKRFNFYGYIYLFSIVVGFLTNLFWMETWAISTLCFYHLHSLIYKYNLLKRRIHK